MCIDAGVVARGGIEPPTRGFSVRRRARFGASKPKSAKKFSARRPNRRDRPILYRAPRELTDRNRRRAHARQRVAGIATERGPNRRAVWGRRVWRNWESGK